MKEYVITLWKWVGGFNWAVRMSNTLVNWWEQIGHLSGSDWLKWSRPQKLQKMCLQTVIQAFSDGFDNFCLQEDMLHCKTNCCSEFISPFCWLVMVIQWRVQLVKLVNLRALKNEEFKRVIHTSTWNTSRNDATAKRQID